MEWVENSFLPWILLTASIATSCVNKASPRFSSWIWMDPLWSNLTLCLLYHLGLKQVTDPQHPGLQDGKQRQKTPGLCGHFWFKVRIMELLTWSVRLWGLALILFNIDVFFLWLLCELFCFFYHDLHDVGLSAVDSEPWTELFALTLTTLTDACVLK